MSVRDKLLRTTLAGDAGVPATRCLRCGKEWLFRRSAGGGDTLYYERAGDRWQPRGPLPWGTRDIVCRCAYRVRIP